MLHFPRPSRLIDLARSRLRPLDIKMESIREVLGNYDLTLVGKPFNLSLSRRTGNVVLPTAEGRKVLKRYRHHLQLDGIRYIHSILSRLQELSFPVPRLIPAVSSNDFMSLPSGKYAVFDFVDGNNFSLDFILPSDRARLIELSGRVLAAFHQSLMGFLPVGVHHLGFISYNDGWRRDFGWFADKAQELEAKSSMILDNQERQVANLLIRVSEEVLEDFQRLDGTLQKASLMRTIIHGDFGLHNLIFQRDGRIVLTDFETARLEWRLCDLVSTLSRSRSRSAMYDFDHIKLFLAGYESVFPIPAEEWQHLPVVWQFFKLRSVFIGWNSYFERGGGKLSSALDAFHQSKWVQNNAGTLLKLRDQ